MTGDNATLNARISDAVLADHRRPCLYHVSGPCFHPKCLEAHFETLRAELLAKQKEHQ